MIAAKLATGTTEDKLQNLRNQPDRLEVGIPPSMTVDRAAALMNVSRATVIEAKQVLRNASPTDVIAIEKGEAAIYPFTKRAKRNAANRAERKVAEKVGGKQLNPQISKIAALSGGGGAPDFEGRVAPWGGVGVGSHLFSAPIRVPPPSRLSIAVPDLSSFSRQQGDEQWLRTRRRRAPC